MSVKNCDVEFDVSTLQDEVNLLNTAVIQIEDDLDHDEDLIEGNGQSIAQLNTNVQKIGGVYGVPISSWSTQNSGFITIPKSTGTWIGCLNNVNLGLPVAGTYLVSLNFTTFTNNGNLGHNPVTVGCELFQDGTGLVTNFTGTCGITTSYPINAPDSGMNGLYGFGVNMTFPVVIFDPTKLFSMSLFYFFNNDDDQSIVIQNGCPDSGSAVDWWRGSINEGSPAFSMTLLSTNSI
jgi:hypothetical protein